MAHRGGHVTTFATVSKYPPYISGHSHQAFWLNRALADLLRHPQHQVTYSGPVPPWCRHPDVLVHQVARSPHANAKAPDGHLVKALAARLVQLIDQDGVDSLLALYTDPHAAVVLRAARTARLLGKRPTVAVSVEGSDITSSLARHTGDGEAAVLLADIAAADVVMAVSERARHLLLATAAEVLPPRAADDLAARTVLRYPGLPAEYFAPPRPADLAQFRRAHGIPPSATVISTFVRLVPEKGVGRVVEIAEEAAGRDDLIFAIAGSGPMADQLAAQTAPLPSVRLLGDLSPQQAHLLRGASALAMLPSRPAADWEETFGIAALEYQALGVPVLASDLPGFVESCAVDDFRIPVDASPQQWLRRADHLLERRDRYSTVAAGFAGRFTARNSATVLLTAVEAAAADRLALQP